MDTNRHSVDCVRVSILGAGRMGSAFAQGLAKGGAVRPSQVVIFDRKPEKARELAHSIGAYYTSSLEEAVGKSEVIVIAVKPDAVEEVIARAYGLLQKKLVISLVGGMPISFLEKCLPPSARAIAAMPNIASGIGKGAAYYLRGRRATASDSARAKRILSSMGYAVETGDESMLDNALISSSGIAFFFLVIGAMAAAAEKNGMTRRAALELAARAAEGAGSMVIRTGKSPDELIGMVAGKKGVTVRGLAVLRKRGVAGAVEKAAAECIRAALERRKRRVDSLYHNNPSLPRDE